MTRSAAPRGPAIWGVCYGFAWVVLMLVLFGVMLTGYSAVWGIRGMLVATAILPISPLAYPAIAWYYTGAFLWFWTLGLLAAFGMGAVIMAD